MRWESTFSCRNHALEVVGPDLIALFIDSIALSDPLRIANLGSYLVALENWSAGSRLFVDNAGPSEELGALVAERVRVASW